MIFHDDELYSDDPGPLQVACMFVCFALGTVTPTAVAGHIERLVDYYADAPLWEKLAWPSIVGIPIVMAVAFVVYER